jgi:hypothetical protein
MLFIENVDDTVNFLWSTYGKTILAVYCIWFEVGDYTWPFYIDIFYYMICYKYWVIFKDFSEMAALVVQ